MKILSTKILTEAQRALFQENNIEIDDYDAISIQFLNFKAPKSIKNAIFTSQNAVRSIEGKNIEIEHVFCVGDKTKELLLENGENVIKSFKNASDLNDFIQKNYKNEEFHFFSGSRRRDEIPLGFKNSKNTLFELKTYKTELNVTKFSEKWSGILFFSPSGVKSFAKNNLFNNSPSFCIGKTTAEEAKKHSNTIFIAEETTIESVIHKAINTLPND